MTSNERMINKRTKEHLEKVVIVQFKVLSKHLPGKCAAFQYCTIPDQDL
jgi:hypothetical protein